MHAKGLHNNNSFRSFAAWILDYINYKVLKSIKKRRIWFHNPHEHRSRSKGGYKALASNIVDSLHKKKFNNYVELQTLASSISN